jgi:hypothetical protein
MAALLLALTAPSATAAWTASVDISKMDGKETLFATVSALNYNEQIPALGIVCRPGDTSLVFDAGRMIKRSGDGSTVPLRIKYDAGSPARVFASPATSHHGAFIRKTGQIHALLKAKRMFVEFTPLYKAPTIAEFDVEGLQQHLLLLKKHCRF